MNKSPRAVKRTRSAVVTHVDGTHMGLAVNWWSAAADDDTATLSTIRRSFPPADVLRSAVEVVLAQASWLTRAACRCGFEPTCSCIDDVHHTLRELAADHLVDPRHQDFCSALADALGRDPSATDLALDPIPVNSIMNLVVFLGSVVEYRHGVPVPVQIASYRRQVIETEATA